MIALARKYRPKQFSDLIAQDHLAAALRGAVAGGRVAHGYLFAGPPGGGKTTAPRLPATALNCERRQAGAGGVRSGGSPFPCRGPPGGGEAPGPPPPPGGPELGGAAGGGGGGRAVR